MVSLLLMTLALSTPALPLADTIAMEVHQDNQLTWQWDPIPNGGDVTSWFIACGKMFSRVIDNPAQRNLYFGDLVTDEGFYMGCTMVARNAAGDSPPFPVANFHYTYSYWPFVKIGSELAGLLASVAALGLFAKSRRNHARHPEGIPYTPTHQLSDLSTTIETIPLKENVYVAPRH